MRQREPHGAAGEPVRHAGHRPRQREPRAHVRHVHDLSLKQLGDQPLGRRVVQVRETHRRHVMSVYDDAVREERVQRCLDAGCGSTSVGRHRTTRHEAHHVGVAHRCGTLERRQFGERQPSESVALDGAQVGPAGLHQQDVAELDRGVAAARLHEGGLAADQVRQVDELVELVGPGCRATAPTIRGARRPVAHGPVRGGTAPSIPLAMTSLSVVLRSSAANAGTALSMRSANRAEAAAIR